MKIAFIYGDLSLGGRPFNPSILRTDSRGLTGSEISCFRIALEMVKRGHEISFFSRFINCVFPGNWEGIHLYNLDDFKTSSTEWDAVCSWNEPDIHRYSPPKSLRLVNQQLNDFNYCHEGFDDFVDVYTSPSVTHCEFLKNDCKNLTKEKFVILPNGCNPDDYSENKVEGRMVWASSCDRGLHWLLQEWKEIKKAVPKAHLKVFYRLARYDFEDFELHTHSQYERGLLEMGQRIRYIKHTLPKLRSLDIEHIGSISRIQMIQEMNEAIVLPYPCDPIRFTEGFSVTTMEACAAGVVPIISKIDSLGEIYGEAVPTIDLPVKNHLKQFRELIIQTLTDEKYREEIKIKAKKLARQYTWTDIAKRLENILISEIAKK